MDKHTEAPIAHGGLHDDELASLGIGLGDVLDLSVNINPYGPCPSVRRAIAEASVERYPDPTASSARRAIAHHLGVDPRRIVLGNGAVDLLWTLARTVLRPGDRVMTVEPAFSEMRSAAVSVGASITEHRTRPEDGFAVEIGALDRRLHEVRPRLVYVCTPSNPSGASVSTAALFDLAARHPETLFVVDVSFLSVSARHAEAESRPPEGIFWVRSLTKDHALPGLRVGYAVVSVPMARQLEAHRPPWSVNAFAQAAAIAVTRDDGLRFVTESRARWLEDRETLTRVLADLGLVVHPSDTVYALADLGPHAPATSLRHRLLRRHRVLVRDATSFGLPGHIRVAARPSRDLDRLVQALRKELPR